MSVNNNDKVNGKFLVVLGADACMSGTAAGGLNRRVRGGKNFVRDTYGPSSDGLGRTSRTCAANTTGGMLETCHCLGKSPAFENEYPARSCSNVTSNSSCTPTCQTGTKLYGAWFCKNAAYDDTRPPTCVSTEKKVVEREGLKSSLGFKVPATMSVDDRVSFASVLKVATKKTVAKKL